MDLDGWGFLVDFDLDVTWDAHLDEKIEGLLLGGLEWCGYRWEWDLLYDIREIYFEPLEKG